MTIRHSLQPVNPENQVVVLQVWTGKEKKALWVLDWARKAGLLDEVVSVMRGEQAVVNAVDGTLAMETTVKSYIFIEVTKSSAELYQRIKTLFANAAISYRMIGYMKARELEPTREKTPTLVEIPLDDHQDDSTIARVRHAIAKIAQTVVVRRSCFLRVEQKIFERLGLQIPLVALRI